MSDLPIVDCAPLGAGDDGLRRVAQAVGRACRGTGFFYAINTGLPAGLRAAAFAQARAFFAADPATKETVSILRSPHNRGYVGHRREALDPAQGADDKEAFNIGLDLPPDDPEVIAGRPFRGLNLWPDLPGFREVALAYLDAAWRVGRALHQAVALDLGLAPTHFEPLLDRPMATLRLLHYPPQSEAGAAGLGAGEHTDYGNLTLLATDGVGGLQVRQRDGGWIDAVPPEDALVCNIGDCLMRWTNDVYVSTPHRVRHPVGRDRYSIAFFLDPNPDALVACLPTCLDPAAGARYSPILASDYLAERLDRTYAHRRSDV